jgi:hypothetical protein
MRARRGCGDARPPREVGRGQRVNLRQREQHLGSRGLAEERSDGGDVRIHDSILDEVSML